MITRYSSYKKVNLDWLETIPEPWSVIRLRYVFDIKKRIAGELGYDVLSITQKGIKIKDTESGAGQLSMDYSKYQIVEKGDFAMNHMDLLTGYVDISEYNGVTSPDYRVFTIQDKAKYHDKYLLYLMQLGYHNKIFFAYGQGSSQLGRWRFPTEQFRDFCIPLPRHEEQKTIASFLDRKTTLIDDLIAKKERMVELLKVKRQAAITQAVTKGLDPYAEMDDSGVSWIGKKPKHWKAKRLKFACLINPSKSELGDIDKSIDVSFLPMEKISENGVLQLTEIRQLKDVYQGFTYFADNDVIMAKITPCFENGKGSICHNLVNGIGFGTTELHVFRSNREILPKFIYYITKSYPFRTMGEAFMQGAAGQKRVSESFIRDFMVTVPSIAEQKTIINALDTITNRIDSVIKNSDLQIEKLKEYRQSLIFAAVTGKIQCQ